MKKVLVVLLSTVTLAFISVGIHSADLYPLHQAAIDGNVARMRELIGQGRSKDDFDKKGFAPVHYAVQMDRYAAVEFLLTIGVNPETRTRGGSTANTPLTIACVNGNANIIRLLLANSADPNRCLIKWVPFEGNVFFNEVRNTVRNKGLVPYNYYEPPLIIALHCTSNKFDVIKMLLSAGADPNAYSFVRCFDGTELIWTIPLITALKRRSLGSIPLLLQFGADPNRVCDRDGTGPWSWAVVEGLLDYVKKFLYCSASLDFSKHKSPLVEASFEGHFDVVQFLLAQGFKVNDVDADADGHTPLHGAVLGNRPRLVQYLLGCGARVNQHNKKSELPLSCAIRNFSAVWMWRREVVIILLRAGAQLDSQSIACLKGRPLDMCPTVAAYWLEHYIAPQQQLNANLSEENQYFFDPSPDWIDFSNTQLVERMEQGVRGWQKERKDFRRLQQARMRGLPNAQAVERYRGKPARVTADNLRGLLKDLPSQKA